MRLYDVEHQWDDVWKVSTFMDNDDNRSLNPIIALILMARKLTLKYTKLWRVTSDDRIFHTFWFSAWWKGSTWKTLTWAISITQNWWGNGIVKKLVSGKPGIKRPNPRPKSQTPCGMWPNVSCTGCIPMLLLKCWQTSSHRRRIRPVVMRRELKEIVMLKRMIFWDETSSKQWTFEFSVWMGNGNKSNAPRQQCRNYQVIRNYLLKR